MGIRVVYTVFDRRQDIPAVFYNLLGVSFKCAPQKGGLRVGDEDVKLIEQNVANNTEDIRELKKDMDKAQEDIAEVKSTIKLMQQSQTHIMENMSDLKSSIRVLGEKWDSKWEQEKKEEADRYEQDKRDQRNRWWWLVFLIIGTIVITQLGLK